MALVPVKINKIVDRIDASEQNEMLPTGRAQCYHFEMSQAPLNYFFVSSEIKNLKDFVEAINHQFVFHLKDAPQWTGNLDAFNDLLRWPESRYVFSILDSEILSTILKSIVRNESNLWNLILEIFDDNKDLVQLQLL